MESAARILYGHPDYMRVDVTDYFRKHYPITTTMTFNDLFGDPCHGVPKCLFFFSSDNHCLGIMLENDHIFIPYRKLVLGAIFKNESWILKEWLDHYLAEGVEHFYLINNNSTDDYLSILAPYLEKGVATLFHEPRSHIQVDAYNQYFMPFQHSADWIIICDLDEFIFSRKGFPRIVDYLESLTNDISAVAIPWKMFGSSHFISHPPDGVVKNFVYRKLYNGGGRFPIGNRNNQSINSKTICRFNAVACLGMHNPVLVKGHGITSDGKDAEMDAFQLVSETSLENSALHINHYVIQSLEFFTTIKKTRTDAFSNSSDYARNDEYFRRYDWNDYCDEELKNKRFPIKN